MKKQLKDPRPTLYFFFRISIFTLILMPLVYFNLKADNIGRIFLFFVAYLIFILLIKKFYPKEIEEYKLQGMTNIGYVFSGLWFFVFLAFIFAISIDYFKQGIFPKTEFLLIITILLFFSIILFYLANKSRKYEKSR